MIHTPSTRTGIKTSPKKHLEYVPGQMIIKVQADAVRPHVGGVGVLSVGESRRIPDDVTAPLEYLRRNAGLKEVRPLFVPPRARVLSAGVAPADRSRMAVLSAVAASESEELEGVVLVKVDPKKVTPALVKHLNASGAIAYAEPMPARWLAASAVDPMRNLQWGLRSIGWFDVQIPDAGEIRVGVLDTGIDAKHPDFAGIPLEYHHEHLRATDIIGHGTHVSGIITAKANNAVGIAGVAQCQLVVHKIFPDKPTQGDFYVDGEIYFRALNAVIAQGVKVVNLSIGGTASSQTEELLFRRLEKNGITVVAAMGNEYTEGNPTEYPGAYTTVFSVGAIAETLRRSYFSNTGKHIDVVAPGSHILSTLPVRRSSYRDETKYASWDGTSMATPHVAAAAALVAARFPEMTAVDIKAHLRKTATRLEAMGNQDFTTSYGSGLINLKQALASG